jgi:hypothetical protein
MNEVARGEFIKTSVLNPIIGNITLFKIKRPHNNYEEDLEDFCESAAIKNQCHNILKKLINSTKISFWRTPFP